MRRNLQKPITGLRSDYATRADFCDAFADDTDSLYLLTFLLTANHEAAERYLVATVKQAFKPSTVFKDWVRSWIRRTLITGAITIVFDGSDRGQASPDSWYPSQGDARFAINAIARVADLDRFVFVMSVLEGYSVHECSLLLSCPPATVIESRARALRDLAELNASLMSVVTGVSLRLAATA
jgi:DNA-directed RNA polymerase specialized sigma24 family protein